MRWVRGTLAAGWLVIVVSLFHDPVTSWLTEPDNASSPFRLSGHTVIVQGESLEQPPYPMGRRVFWTMVFPCVPLFLMVFGHEAWRRICPLSFFSQIPRMLGRRPRRRRFNRASGQVEERLRLVKPDSWLRTNFWYLQFGLLWLGVSIRLVATNGSAPALGTFILLVIAAAITVGYLFGGKTWCNYICPVSVVQRIYTGPHGLFESQAHLQKHPVTQSMCRVTTATGAQSNCVGCVSPCPDIDLERSYWQTLEQPGRRFAYYGYVGLVIGFYGYYYLYAGNWDYYYSGAWTHEEGILSAATLFGPGFYLWGREVPVPKIAAAPLTIAGCILAAYGLGCTLERLYVWTLARHGLPVDRRVVLHRSFSITTFLAINLFYLFAGRPNIRLLPEFVQSALNAAIVTLSTLWLVRSLARSPARYQRESLVNALLKQLKKFTTDFSRFLDGRSLDDLGPDEVYLLAKTAPGVSQEQKQGVYKDVLQESIATGRTNSSQSLAMLAELRLQVGVTDDQHHAILQELGVEDPSLLDPLVRKEQEDQLRLDNYSTALQALTTRAVERGIGPDTLAESPEFSAELHTLRSVYQISSAEQARAQKKIAGNGAGWRNHTAQLLREIGRLSASLHSLRHFAPDRSDPLCRILSRGVSDQRQRHAATLLRIAASAEQPDAALHFAHALHGLLGEEAQELTRSTQWKRAIASNPEVEGGVSEALLGRVSAGRAGADPSLATFTFREAVAAAPELSLVYATLAGDVDPVMSGTAIAALWRDDPAKAEHVLRARTGEFDEVPWFIQEVAASLTSSSSDPAAPGTAVGAGYQLVQTTTMAKLGWLTDIDLFDKMPLGSLAALARHGELRRYAQGATICHEGQRADCMFLLLSGDAEVFIGRNGGLHRVSRVEAGQTVGEMGVFTKKPRAATVVIASATADLLEFSEEDLDEVWENPHASRGVLLKVFDYYQLARSQAPSPPPAVGSRPVPAQSTL